MGTGSSAGIPAAIAETSYELTYRAPVTGWLALAPSVQFVSNPGADLAMLSVAIRTLAHAEACGRVVVFRLSRWRLEVAGLDVTDGAGGVEGGECGGEAVTGG